MTATTIRVPGDMKKKLEKAAIDLTVHRKEVVSMSEVLRRLIKDHLETTVETMKKEVVK